MKLESNGEFIYLHFESAEFKNEGEIRKLIMAKIEHNFKQEGEYYLDRDLGAWVFDNTEKNVNKIEGITGEKVQACNP